MERNHEFRDEQIHVDMSPFVGKAEPREDHASYIEHWLTVLREDKRAIFSAVAHAQRAADLTDTSGAKRLRSNLPPGPRFGELRNSEPRRGT